MDHILYNFLGYATEEYTYRAAIRIQRAYRNHKSYELGWRTDRIKCLVPIQDSFDPCEEHDYWDEQRTLVRYGSQWVEI